MKILISEIHRINNNHIFNYKKLNFHICKKNNFNSIFLYFNTLRIRHFLNFLNFKFFKFRNIYTYNIYTYIHILHFYILL